MDRQAVHRLAVALLEDDLGREILGRAAERPAAVLDVLGEAEVGQLERAVLVKQSRGAYGRSEQSMLAIGALERGRPARRAMFYLYIYCVCVPARRGCSRA